MPEQQEALVKLDNVCLSFNDISVLDNISFEILPGRIVTLIGPNGAGKTTLLKIILGIIRPDSGSIRKKPGIKIGYIPQKLNLSRAIPLTVKRFLCLDAPYGDKELAGVLKQTGLPPEILQRSVHPLSGGEMQRVMLARTLLKQPDLLVLDEPAQGLDPVGEEQFYALLDELNQTKSAPLSWCRTICISSWPDRIRYCASTVISAVPALPMKSPICRDTAVYTVKTGFGRLSASS